MKQTIIATIEATDIVDMPEITLDQIEEIKKGLSRDIGELGLGLDDFHIKLQVFQHDDK